MEERSSRGRTPSAMEERSSSGYGTVELDEVTRSAVSELDELVGRRSRPSALDAAPGPIAVAPVPAHGLGRAINDRLQRAAAPRS